MKPLSMYYSVSRKTQRQARGFMPWVDGPGIVDVPTIFAWTLYIGILFSPLYLFPSGLPQIGDCITLLATVPILLFGMRCLQRDISIKWMMSFVVYTWVVGLFWFPFIDQSYSTLPSYFHSVYYTYNLLVMCAVVVLARSRRLNVYRGLAWSVAVAIFALVGLIPVISSAGRATLTFNNPNQLGYFALLSMAIVLVCSRQTLLSKGFVWICMAGSLVLAAVSLSKAAIISLLLLNSGYFCITVMRNPTRFIMRFIGTCVAILAVAAIAYAVLGEDRQQRLIGRFSPGIFANSDDSLAGRGYDRMAEFWHYNLLGAGEGGYYRFANTNLDAELHSGLAVILFCYGIPGLIFVVLALLSAIRRSNAVNILSLSCAGMYNLTHQGLRTTLLWVLIGLIIASSTRTRNIEGSKC